MSDDGESWKGGEQGPPPDEFEERIKLLLMASPFRPFEVVLFGGERRSAVGCCSVAIGPTTMSSLPPPKGGSAFFRKDQIVGVEVPEPAA